MTNWILSSSCDLFCQLPLAPCGEANMLQTLALVLVILWILGLVSSYTLGGFIHLLLVLAIISILISVIQGRRIL
ncbi:MAG: lmo0937 family membrane protein [Methylococcales bacterium]